MLDKFGYNKKITMAVVIVKHAVGLMKVTEFNSFRERLGNFMTADNVCEFHAS